MNGNRKLLIAAWGILAILILGVLRVPNSGELAIAIAGIVATFMGAHAVADFKTKPLPGVTP